MIVPAGAPPGALPVGSLQKPFVAKAWAETHAGRLPPRLACAGGPSCWLPAGHGTSDLVRALAVSCNAYFVQLAGDTPPGDLTRVLREEGFRVEGDVKPAGAIGLADGPPATITPEALLRAYARLVSRPWASGENVRTLVLRGLREAARHGTAQGLARRGVWAKTGTVAALDGAPLQTSGWALALDDAGRGLLALLPRGTGREAARAAAGLFEGGASTPAARPGEPPEVVRVRLLDLLAPRRVDVLNVGDAPVALAGPRAGDAWLGPGARLTLAAGARVGEGLLELRAPEFGFVRRLRGTLAAGGDAGRGLRLTAEVALDEYVAGVLAAEAPQADAALREELATVVLRFLSMGPRHAPDADVCDATHCAVFGGRGPRLAWLDPRRARVIAPDAGFAPLDPASWARVRDRARTPGARHFSGHCGGAPLSERYVWGRGESAVTACPRHPPGSGATWRRLWPRPPLERAFGQAPRALRVDDGDGVWRLVVDLPGTTRRLQFDDAHRVLATALSWDALPSPATRVTPRGDAFEATGVGAGHRVGLCLGMGGAGP